MCRAERPAEAADIASLGNGGSRPSRRHAWLTGRALTNRALTPRTAASPRSWWRTGRRHLRSAREGTDPLRKGGLTESSIKHLDRRGLTNTTGSNERFL